MRPRDASGSRHPRRLPASAYRRYPTQAIHVMRMTVLFESVLRSLTGHVSLFLAIPLVLSIATAHSSCGTPPTRSFDPIHLARDQSLAYCGPEGRMHFAPGAIVLLGCRNDSLTLNGHALGLESFPSNRICDLSLMQQLFGAAPRVQDLMSDARSSPADTSAWLAAIRQYAAEVRAVFDGKSGQNADSLFDLWPLNRRPPRPHYDTALDLWAQLKWQQNPEAVYPQIAWTNLRGVVIPFTQGFHFTCSTAESLSIYLEEVVRSGKPFRVELGSGLLFWGRN